MPHFHIHRYRCRTRRIYYIYADTVIHLYQCVCVCLCLCVNTCTIMFISFVLRADEDCLRNENIYVANLCGSRSCCCCFNVVAAVVVVCCFVVFCACLCFIFSAARLLLVSWLVCLVCISYSDFFVLSPSSLLFFVFVFVLTAVGVSAGRLLHCTVDPCKWDLLPGPVA